MYRFDFISWLMCLFFGIALICFAIILGGCNRSGSKKDFDGEPLPNLTCYYDGEKVVLVVDATSDQFLSIVRLGESQKELLFVGTAVVYDYICPGKYVYELRFKDHVFSCEVSTLPALEAMFGQSWLKHKVAICHNGHTIYVDYHAVPAHLAHGDSLGLCSNENKSPSSDDLPPIEICDNGIDDNGNGFVDCEDTDCSEFSGCYNDPISPCEEGGWMFANDFVVRRWRAR